MNTPHKHAAVIKAWADGAAIEARFRNSLSHSFGPWQHITAPSWDTTGHAEYRVKPEPHKWQKEIDAYVAGKTVEYYSTGRQCWIRLPGYRSTDPHERPDFQFNWPGSQFRIKPETVVKFVHAKLDVQSGALSIVYKAQDGTLKLIFEDGKLIDAEVLK